MMLSQVSASTSTKQAASALLKEGLTRLRQDKEDYQSSVTEEIETEEVSTN